MDNMEYNNNKDIENSLNNTIKRIVGDLANLSFTYLLKETHLTYEEYNNVKKCKEIIIQTMIPVVISGLKSENKYNLDYVVNHIFLDKFSIFDNTEILKIKTRLESIHIDSLYSLFYHTSETILCFFELIDSDNNVITDTDKENLHTEKLLTFTNLFSILLEICFSNNQQLSNLNLNNLKELINSINNNLNNKIINNKNIINLVSLLSNVNYKCRIEILKYFNIELTEKIKQLTNLNLAKLKTKDKDTNKTIVDKNILKDIKETLNTFINTSAITLVIIKAIVHIVNLITEKIPMLSSMINKGSNMISNGINSIGSSINLSSGKTGKTKSQKQLKPSSKHNVSVDTEIKNYASRNKDRKNNKDANNPLGNNGANNNLNSGKGKNITPDGGGSITPPSGTNGRIGNSNPLIPVQNGGDNKTNGKRNTEIKDLEPKKDITDNSQTTTNDSGAVKDSVMDYTENNKMEKNKEFDDNQNDINKFNMYDDLSEFNIDNNREELDNSGNNLEKYSRSQSLSQDTTSNSSEDNPTPAQSLTDTDNTADINNTGDINNIDNKTDNNKNHNNNLSNNNSQNNTKSTSFQDKLKKENKSNESAIEKEKKKHEESENKSHTEVIKKKGDDSPDNSPRLR